MGFLDNIFGKNNKEQQQSYEFVTNREESYETRLKAVEKIQDEGLLLKIAHCRKIESGITNEAENVLTNINKEKDRSKIKYKKYYPKDFKKLNHTTKSSYLYHYTNEDIIISIAKYDKDKVICEAAVNKISDESALIDIAKKHSDKEVRRSAIDKITDEAALNAIARKDSDEFNRIAAAEKNNNQEALIYIAKNSTNEYARKAAVKRINDRSALMDIAETDSDEFTRIEAAEKTNDEDVLIGIAKNSSDAIARRDAVKKITNQSVLIDIAKNDSNGFVCVEAVDRITDESVLIDLAKNETYYIRCRAVKNPNLKDRDVLTDIAKNDSYNEKKETFTRKTGKIIGYSDHDGDEYEWERVTVYEFPVRQAASKRLGGAYSNYCKVERTSTIK